MDGEQRTSEEQRTVKTMRLQPANRMQLSVILEYMLKHDDFCQGKVTPNFTFKDKKRHWEILAQKLNSMGDTQGKSAGKWQRTWIDWRHSVKKKAKEIKRQKERGFQTKTLSPLEVRALRLFRKLESGKGQTDSDLNDLELPEIEQDESIGSETTGIEEVKIEDVLSISENSNTSSYDDDLGPSGASISSSPLRPIESSSSVTSKTPFSDAMKAVAKDNVPTSCVVNSVYVVSTKAVPPLAVKKSSSSVVNTPTVPLLPKIKQEVIEEVDISGNTAISESSTRLSTVKDRKKTPPTDHLSPENHSQISPEDTDEEFENCPSPPKRRIEDTLGGLPLTLQSSILERLDTLNRNIETNTCALTILAKAVNDSAETNMRAANQLAKSLNNIGKMVGSCMELLKAKQQEK